MIFEVQICTRSFDVSFSAILPSIVNKALCFELFSLKLSLAVLGKIIGRVVNECGAMGVTTKASRYGNIIGPPAAKL